MKNNIVKINEIINQKQIDKIPKVFELDDVYEYFNIIHDYLKELKSLSMEDEKYHNFCFHEEFGLLTNIYSSFIKILFDYYNNESKYEESERVLGEFLSELYIICEKINMGESKNKVPEQFYLEDIIKYANIIEYKLNEYYELSLKDKKYYLECTNNQRRILIMIYSSFFNILSLEYKNFDDNENGGRIISKFLNELYLICDNMVDIENLRKNIDKNVLKFEKNE